MTDQTRLAESKPRADVLGESWALGTLLAALCFLLLVSPLYERLTLHTAMTLVLAAVVFSNRRERRIFWASILFAFVVVALLWSNFFVDSTGLIAAECLVAAVFFIGTAVVTLNSVVRYHLASVQSIFGVISAYLLLGLAWAMFYRASILIEPSSIEFSAPRTVQLPGHEGETIAFSQIIYFSFVTMSTVGYGDALPRGSLTRTVAWMQAVAGQFYVAVLVAWLVSALPSPHRRDDTTGT